jgi:hypothetical protein
MRPRLLLLSTLAAATLLVGCSTKPNTTDLVAKLKQRNGLSTAEATCVRDGLMAQTDDATLARIAEARTTAKLRPEDGALIRAVLDKCVPTDTASGPVAP